MNAIPVRKIVLLSSCLMLAFGNVAQAGRNDALFNRQLDFDNDGMLSKDEIQVGLIHRRSKLNLPALREKARKNGGKLPKSFFADYDPLEMKDDYKTLCQHYGGREAPFPVDGIDHEDLITTMQMPGPTKEALAAAPPVSKWDLRVRRDVGKVKGALANPADASSLTDPYAEGALFSYSRNLAAKEDVWSARGAIGFQYSLLEAPDYTPHQGPEGSVVPAPRRGPLKDFNWLIATTFDRVSAGGAIAENSIDQLSFETGLSGRWVWGAKHPGPFWMSGATGSLTGTLASDFDFNKRVWSVNFDLEPVWNLPGLFRLGQIRKYSSRIGRESSWLEYRWGLNFHVESGVVEEAGSSSRLRQYDSFLRVGGKASIELWPLPEYFHHRLALSASYARYQGLLSRNTSPDSFHASARYVLPTGSGLSERRKAAGDAESPYVREQRSIIWTLQAEYVKGETPLLDDKDHSITIGLGVAF